MSTFKSKMSAGLVALVLGSTVTVSGVVAASPAMAGGFGHHGGGFGHHGGGWGHGWGYGYGGYYGGCYLKKFVTYDGDIVFKKVCY